MTAFPRRFRPIATRVAVACAMFVASSIAPADAEVIVIEAEVEAAQQEAVQNAEEAAKAAMERVAQRAAELNADAAAQNAADRAAEIRARIEQGQIASQKRLREREPIDTAALDAIVLPPNPTEEQSKAYVNAILDASEKQKYVLSFDPQVAKLAAVPPEHFLTLYAQADSRTNRAGAYVTYLLSSEHGVRYKPQVIANLAANPGLITVVEKQGWASDAADAIIAVFRKDPLNADSRWMRLAIATNDPRVLDPLMVRLANLRGRRSTFGYIERLGLAQRDLDFIVDETWKSVADDPSEVHSFAPVAAMYGHTDALDLLIDNYRRSLEANARRDPAAAERIGKMLRQQIGNSLRPAFDYRGEPDDFFDWLEANRPLLEWDPASRKYSLPTVG